MFVADPVGAGAGDGSTSAAGATGPRARDTGARGSSPSGVAALAAALDGLLVGDVEGWSDGELTAVMVELRRQQARLAAVVAEATAVFDARQVHAEDGARSATDWIAVHARVPRGQAGREVREGRRLRVMPATRAAFRAGDINPAHVGVLCRLAGHPRAGAHFAEGEANLVDHARELRFDDWQQLTDHWLAAADPDGPEHKRQRDQDLRRFAVPVGLDGVGHPDGYLTPLAAETVNEALARIERELFEADWAAAREVHGDDVTAAHLARSSAQRRHDALVEMAVRAMTAPAGGRRPAPLVTVMVDYPTLAGRVCQLAGSGTVIAPGDIAALLGEDETLIERVVFDGPNRVRDISTARPFRGALRRMVELTHPRCEDPTCFVPAKDCEGDHIVPWSEGGATSQDNGRMGCGFHNRLWYRRPDLRPPGRQPTPTPPTNDPSGANEPDQPGPDAAHTGAPDEPAHDPPGDPAYDPPGDAPHGPADTIDRRTDQPPHRCRPRPGGPDLVVTIGDTRLAITANARKRRRSASAPSRYPRSALPGTRDTRHAESASHDRGSADTEDGTTT